MPELSTENGEITVFCSQSDNFISIESEIEEEPCSEIFETKLGIPATIKEEFENGEEDIYVAVGKSNSSMEALLWALKQYATNPSSSFIYLVHVFPEVRHIPTPLGKLPKNQVSPDMLEKYMNQERNKRSELLQKFLDICHTSKVKVDTMVVESDHIAKAVLDLIPILNIRTLILGTTKSNLRKLRKANGIADQILKSAPDSCNVKIICQGKEVIDQTDMMSASPRGGDITENQTGDQNEDPSSSCACFTRKFI